MNGKRLIVTADDLGLMPAVSEGIFASHRQGIVTAASLLVNAPGTEHAVAASREYPDLEIGIHLGIVEGFALSGAESLVDDLRYFPGGVCLHRDWRHFLRRFLTGRIDLGQLRRELEAQIERFLSHFDRIPFANATQHLQLLPGVRPIFIELARKYRIGAVRAAGLARPKVLGERGLIALAFDHLGRATHRRATAGGLHCTDYTLGFESSGRLSEGELHAMIATLPSGTAELVAHPGHECPELRLQLPRSYGGFNWEIERAALCSPKVRRSLERAGVELIRFADL
jgi:predicted glycoside hydrolase/deacetylase ChbG (UPF0249 family)